MRVFVDTNFLLSALIFRGFSADVFRLILKKHQLIYSEQVKQELMQKLKSKLMITDDRLQEVLKTLYSLEMVINYQNITYSLRDKDDEIILSTAIYQKCDVLITGDQDLLTVNNKVNQIEILSPREFWEKYT